MIKPLEILSTLQNAFIDTAEFALVGSALVNEVSGGKYKYADVDIICKTRMSRDLTELVFGGLFDVVKIEHPETGNQYQEVPIMKRTLVYLVDGTVIDFLTLKPGVSFDDWCTNHADATHACAHMTALLGEDYKFVLTATETFKSFFLSGNPIPTPSVWGGSEDFVEKAISKYGAVHIRIGRPIKSAYSSSMYRKLRD